MMKLLDANGVQYLNDYWNKNVRHFGEKFATMCTESCHFDIWRIQLSNWQQFRFRELGNDRHVE